MRDRIYLAAPYYHKDPKIRKLRTDYCDIACIQLMRQGYTVFSPLSYTHRLACMMDNEEDGRFWLNQVMPYVDWADLFVIYRLTGWKESVGIQLELKKWERRHYKRPPHYIEWQEESNTIKLVTS